MKTYLLFFFCFMPVCASAENIKTFVSDGCSLFPDGTIGQNELWQMCCYEHDYAYWKGGSYEERLVVDIRLKQCVEDVGNPSIAKLMLAGVRVGGSPYLPTKFRWGYGWGYFRGYKTLTAQEQAKIVEGK